MNNKISQALTSILDRFKNNQVPAAIAHSMFPIPNIPSAKWSLLNRILMFFAGTHDGRGFRQWNEANRYVKKGAKAFYILVPLIKKAEDKDTKEEKQVLKGFKCSPVFRCEDTDGEPLDYEQVGTLQLPLVERAEEWGINVKAVPGNYGYFGYYSSENKLIGLASKDECVFFHELAHCAHEKIKGCLQKGQDPMQEIVAELAAQTLCRCVGKQPQDSLGNSYAYIESYSKNLSITPYAACMKALTDTEKVLNVILKRELVHDAQAA